MAQSPQYCDPCQLELSILRQLLKFSDGNFDVTDPNGRVVFNVIGKVFTTHCRRVLVDAAGNPIATLLQKTLSAHDRWRVYKGESDKKSDLLFSVKKSRTLQRQPKLRVFLATNKQEDACDFKVEKSGSSWLIYSGESSTILAWTLSAHDRWRVYKGESNKESDLLFSVKKSKILQRKPKLRVFLATNKQKHACDFKVEKSGSSWVIYDGESPTILAWMARDQKFYQKTANFFYRKIWHGKDKFKLTINPKIDYAFMVILIVILDGIKEHGTTWLDLLKVGIRLSNCGLNIC